MGRPCHEPPLKRGPVTQQPKPPMNNIRHEIWSHTRKPLRGFRLDRLPFLREGRGDQVNRLLVVLELSVVIMFLIDLVLVFIGLLISLKGS